MTTTIRDEREDDASAVTAVVRTAFGDEGEGVAAIWSDLVRGGGVRASLVAEVDGRVVGHVGVSGCWVDARRALVEALLLSPLSVLPDEQRQGTGTALVAAAVERAGELGAPALFLEGSPAFYGRRGFERAGAHGFLPASVRTPDRAFQVVRLPALQEWMTGRVVYPDVWWRHDGAGLRDPVLAELEELLGRSG